jgi:hypothetical protein
MGRFKCEEIAKDTRRVRNLSEEDVAKYLAKTGLLFANKAR